MLCSRMLRDVLTALCSTMRLLRAQLAVLARAVLTRRAWRLAKSGGNPRTRATATTCFGRAGVPGNAVLRGLAASLTHAQPVEDGP